MYHLIEFTASITADLEIPFRHRLEQVHLEKGAQALVSLRPKIAETFLGPVELADLYFEDGTVARNIRFEKFCFVD